MNIKDPSVVIPRYVFKRIAMLPINLPKVLVASTVEPSVLLDSETVLPLSKYRLLWQLVSEACRDPAVGIRVANKVHPEHFGAVDYSIMTSKTLAQAYHHLSRYNRIKEMCRLELHVEEQASVSFHWPLPHLPIPHIESALVYVVALFRWLSDTAVRPLKVCFTFSRPDHCEALEAYFAAPVHFEQNMDVLVFDKSDFERSVVWQNSELNRAFAATANRKIVALKQKKSFTGQVSELIEDMLVYGNPSAAKVAAGLNISLRTLHRKLQAEKTSFQQLLDDTRKRQALRLVKSGDLELKAIAFRLGYANVSAFCRAFRRWMGQTPMAYRQGSPDFLD